MHDGTPLVEPIGFDHVNLKTRDMARAINFCARVLGMRLARAEHNADGRVRFASLRAGDLLIDLQPNAGNWSAVDGGLNQVAILIEPTDLDAPSGKLRDLGVPISDGPVRRQGAFDFGQARYLQDTDGHDVKLKHHEWPLIPDQSAH